MREFLLMIAKSLYVDTYIGKDTRSNIHKNGKCGCLKLCDAILAHLDYNSNEFLTRPHLLTTCMSSISMKNSLVKIFAQQNMGLTEYKFVVPLFALKIY